MMSSADGGCEFGHLPRSDNSLRRRQPWFGIATMAGRAE